MTTEITDEKQEKTIEVHNVYAIYRLTGEDSEDGMVILSYDRPEDWGHERWTYRRFKFECWIDNVRYINNCHCWTDLKRTEDESLQLFSSSIVTILMPGHEPELCGRDYLNDDDFWREEWGEMPPYYYGSDEDDEDSEDDD